MSRRETGFGWHKPGMTDTRPGAKMPAGGFVRAALPGRKKWQ
ncbi:hypothetical protein B4100_3756 [Heyndrickxia coagulans]|nr:hypothetical protein B4100_3756 [Heyndrickxia coagulans]